MAGGGVELDLHGMNTYQAQIAVDAALRRAGNGTYRLRLIHGYRGGTAIRDMLWLTYGRRSQVKRMVSVSEGVTELVLGYPKNMDGTLGPRAEKAAAFAETLRAATGLSVTLWDERRTTIDAHNILFSNGKNAKKRKKTVGAVAAALMLEGYLTRRRLEAQS